MQRTAAQYVCNPVSARHIARGRLEVNRSLLGRSICYRSLLAGSVAS